MSPTPETKLQRFGNRLNVECDTLQLFLTENDPLTAVKYEELLIRRESIKKLYVKLEEAIDTVDPTSQVTVDALAVSARYYEVNARAVFMCKDYDSKLIENNSNSNASVANGYPQSHQVNFKLPEIKLPVFDGEITNWQIFKDTFEALIIETSLPNSTKFHYLLGCLKGGAKNLLLNLSATGDNFPIAWDLLKRRFDSPRSLVTRHLQLLLAPPELTAGSAASLQKLIDFYRLHVNALRAVQPHADLADLLLIGLTTKGLPSDIIKQWEITLKADELPSFDALLDYLQLQQRSLQAVPSVPEQLNKVSKGKPNSVQIPNSSTHIALKCPKCKSEHPLRECSSFLNLKPKDRCKFIADNNRCLKCLCVKSATHSCNFKCPICQLDHHKLLHINDKPPVQTSTSNVTIASSNFTNSLKCLLPTAQVNCVNVNGRQHTFTALLDTGSGANLITASAVSRLRLPRAKCFTTISGVTADVTTSTHSTTVTIRSCNFLKPWSTTISCAVVEQIPKALDHTVCTDSWDLPKDLFYADPTFEHSKEIDLLLGSAFFFDILLPDKFTRTDGPYPVVQETHLGYIVGGRIPLAPVSTVNCNFVQPNLNLPDQIKSFWEVEEVTPSRPMLHEEEVAEGHFVSTHSRDESGRYIVRLPIKQSLNLLGESKGQALKRFHALEGRFERDPELKIMYQGFIDEYLNLGHMQLAPKSDGVRPYVVPHHAIRKPTSQTTPLRVVFDFSAKTSTKYSLNDVLLNGGKLQEDLFDTLLKFRLHKVAIVADLEKMFRQVRVHPADGHLQHILWRSSPTCPVQEFVLNTVTYGAKPATFLAVRVLHQLVEDEGAPFPLASDAIKHSFYVDDLLHSVSDASTAVRTISELNQLLAKGGFSLRKWASNDKTTLLSLPTTSLAKSKVKTFTTKKTDHISTLGVSWDTDLDLLSLTLPDTLNFHDTRFTKRRMLSVISSVFDPLGLLAPCIITCKLLFQEIWNYDLNWDDSLPSPIATKWLDVFDSLKQIPSLKFPRCVLPLASTATSLHGFSDSSLVAYGAAIYLSYTTERGDRVSNLLCAKSKVTPSHMKDKHDSTLTIPRLELCAAVLLIKLLNKVISIFAGRVHFQNINCWCDSRIVLDWLRSPPLKGNVFAKNRALYIREVSANVTWRYVSTQNNPADLLSRGITPKDLQSKHEWWYGPPFLVADSSEWPNKFTLNFDTPVRTLHVKVQSVSYLNSRVCSHYNSFQRMTRVMAQILRYIRFVKECVAAARESRPALLLRGPLSVSELNDAELHCIRIVQQVSFPAVLKALSNNLDCPTEGGLVPLKPLIHKDGCLRVGGRISEADLPEETLHPLILPRTHHLTSALILDSHKRLLHANVQTLSVFLRQRFWIVSLRRAIKSVIRTCLTCFRHAPKPAQQLMGDLPAVRVQQNATFRSVGVDYTGHFWIRFGIRGKARAKVYLAFFVCMVTKAAHIEIVSSLTTNAFLMALKRFVARRGLPNVIYSDNSTTFTGSHKRLEALFNLLSSSAFQKDITEFCSLSRIKWKFIPPRSPHVGGIWESGIKSFKKHLLKELGESTFTYEELLTVSLQAESILNSRPLTRPSDDVSDFDYLTPGHFLIGRPINALPSPAASLQLDPPRWDIYQENMSLIWKRWSKEYLCTLQERSKWNTVHPDLKVGTPVLVIDDNLPPLVWRLGVIDAVFPGRDDRVRTVSVRTNNGVITRHVNRLCPLPSEANSHST